MLRFKEARGRDYEDQISDSSWTPHEIKDLDSNQGSHIRPGKLKTAVVLGRLLDLDNYFQAAQVADEAMVLKSQVDVAIAQLKGSTGELMAYQASLKKEKDADAKVEIQAKIEAVKKAIDGHNKAIAEKQTKLDELLKAREEAARLKAEADAKEKAEAEEKARVEEEAAKLAADEAAAKAAEAGENATPPAGDPAQEEIQKAKMQQYAELIAGGMSEAEAQETVWPAVAPTAPN